MYAAATDTLELTEENVETVLDEVRRCLLEAGGGLVLCSFCLFILLPILPLSASPTHPPPTLPASPPRRPYLVGTGGGGLELVELDGPIAKVQITGPAANVMTVRVAVTQKLRERIPAIAAVQLVN